MAQVKVCIVSQQRKADYSVFFVNSASKEKNAQLIAKGKLVTQEYDANVKVFIVDHESNANIKITRDNFPR